MEPIPREDPPPLARLARIAAFVASAALAAGALRFAWYRPLVAAAMLAGALLFAGGRWLSRWRLRRLLQSGDVASVLARWSRAFERVPHKETMGPLMTATAFAAYGWVDKARAALAAAERGPAWDAALEHRLFLDALLLTFEGDRDGALDRAGRLARLPLPATRAVVRGRVQLLRLAIGALARAFAHRAEPGDPELLEHASETSPLVFWAMRYAAAVVASASGDEATARRRGAAAPRGPAESAFRAFHDEIAARVGSA